MALVTIQYQRNELLIPTARVLNGSAVLATRYGVTKAHAIYRARMVDAESLMQIRCESDWIDGGCTNVRGPNPEDWIGWQRRVGRKGDRFWLCPEHAKEHPIYFVSKNGRMERVE